MTDTTLNKFMRAEAAADYVDERLAHSEPATLGRTWLTSTRTWPSRSVTSMLRRPWDRSSGSWSREKKNGNRPRVRPGRQTNGSRPWRRPCRRPAGPCPGSRPGRKQVSSGQISGWRTKRPRSIASAWSRISTCTWPNSARPTREALEEEKQQAREQATAAAQTNVQQELQRLQAQETRYLDVYKPITRILKETNKTLVTERNAWKKKYEELVVKVKPYIEALKQLPERLVSSVQWFFVQPG